jgi:NAD(P)-dependent dehydrogenase (short-subunit alcohol dehydrogenase family)
VKLEGLDGKVGIVTGAAQGIGLAIAQSLAANAMKVALLDVRREQVEAAAKQIPAAIGVHVDVTRRDSVDAAFAEVERLLGPPDVLVNNAGIIAWKSFEEIDERDWDKLMDVNAKGVFLCCRAAYFTMRSRGRCCIVNITSSAGKKATTACPHYAASKAAVLNLTLSLAADLAPYGVRVNGIAPALIETDMFEGKDVAKLSPVGRMGRTSEVADAVAFLCSDNAAFITGEILDVNGGFLMD